MSRRRLSRSRLAWLLPQVGFLALLVGCAPHLPQSTIAPKSDYNRDILEIYQLIFILSVIVFVLVEGALLYAVFRFRARPGDPLPKQIHGSTKLEIGWTILPAVVLVIIGVPSIDLVFKSRSGAPPPGSYPVTAVGHQWWFEFRYPDLNLVTGNELHLVRGRPVDLTIESVDVIHSFWVPQLGGKIDMIPTHQNKLSFTPLEAGYYFGQCAELCGIQHANMRFRVIVHEPPDFDAWVARMRQGVTVTAEKAQRGQELFNQRACAGCHTIEGNQLARGQVGPNLTRLGERTTLAAGIRPNDKQHLVEWIRDPQAVKVGNLMPNLLLPPDEVDAIATYLLSQCEPAHCVVKDPAAPATPGGGGH